MEAAVKKERKRTCKLVLTRFILTVFMLVLATGPSFSGSLKSVKPEEVGLSSARLERLTDVMKQYVDDESIAGAVMMVVRGGRVAYFKSVGYLDVDSKRPMPANAIFRIASQTKAITTTAIMMLMEEGKLLLGDPVSKFIPEFKETTVARQASDKGAKGYSVVPARRQITIRDLLTHTAGISYGYGPAQDLYKAAGVQGWFFADRDETIGDCIKKLARLPFDEQPGEKWVYGFNTDILGYVVEIVSGLNLADFFKKKITDPLGMADTHFFLPESKTNRFAAAYGAGEDGQLKVIEDSKKSFYVIGPRKCFSGGAGLVSTAEDYARFLQMLANGGEFGGVRILSPKSVELMTVNHAGSLFGDQGFGFGFWITKDLGKGSEPGSVGAFGWGGAYFTTYWVDPVEKLVAVFMTQLLPPPARASDLQAKFKTLVYQAITTSYK